MKASQTVRRGAPAMLIAWAMLAMASAQGQDAKPDLKVFNTRAQVTIDAQGHATAVQLAPGLPDAVAQFVERQVKQWRFQAPVIDGQPRGGQTWLSLGACAAPVAQGYQLAVHYKGSGPASTRADGRLFPPRYPPQAATQGIEMDANVTFVVQPDGTALLESVDYHEGKSQRRMFEPGLKDWVRAMRFEPEQVDGQPVRTRMTMMVTYRVDDGRAGRKPMQGPPAPEDRSECQAAMQEGDAQRPIAVDSPFKRIDTQG